MSKDTINFGDQKISIRETFTSPMHNIDRPDAHKWSFGDCHTCHNVFCVKGSYCCLCGAKKKVFRVA